MQAASAVYGRGREKDRPLLIGSVKTNIGHLETAAGVAGLIKTVLAMRRGLIPGQLHFRNPNPHLDWERLPVRVTSEATDWPLRPDRPPRAAVSAFGISGTNAHVVVEGYGAAGGRDGHVPAGSAQPVAVSMPLPEPDLPLPEEGVLRTRGTRFLPLSGKSADALGELAGQYLDWLEERAEELSNEGDAHDLLADMAWTAGVGRSHFEYRAGVVFRDPASLRDGLRRLAGPDELPQPAAAGKVAFAYTGEGSEWIGEGKALYESEPVVRAVLDRCDAVLQEERGASLLDAMFTREGLGGTPDGPGWTQPAAYALQCALAALWSSVGIRPSAAVGQGLGELAAAQAAGVFGLEDGLRLAAARGSEEDPEAVLEGIAVSPPSFALVSSATGRTMESGDPLDGAYWRRQAGEQAAFDRCVETLAGLGVQAIVEIGPDALPGPMVAPAWPESGAGPEAEGNASRTSGDGAGAPVVLASLRDSQENDGFPAAVAGAYEAGLAVSFAGLFSGESRRRVSLPGYPFQRRSHWIETPDTGSRSRG